MLVTTADPELEPPLMTVNTVLSLLAVDYPDVDKLACYVSDDGCSPVTCYALREAAGFARLWGPFCKRHGVGVRAPFMYFASRRPEPELAGDWTFIKVSLPSFFYCTLAVSSIQFIYPLRPVVVAE